MMRGRLADCKRTRHTVDLQNRIYGRVGSVSVDYRGASDAQRAAAVVAEAGVLTVDLLIYVATEHVDRPRAARKRDRERLMVGFVQPDRLDAAAVFAAHGIVARERELSDDASWHGLHGLIAELLGEHFPLDDRHRRMLAQGLEAEALGLWSLEVVYSTAVLDALLGGDGAGELSLFDEWAANAFVDQSTLAGVWRQGGERYLSLLGDGLIVGVAGSDRLIAELPDDGETAAGDEIVAVSDDEIADFINRHVQEVGRRYPREKMHDTISTVLALSLASVGREPGEASDDTQLTAQTMARVGYVSRIVETEMFRTARAVPPELSEILVQHHGRPPYWWETIANFSAATAKSESLSPPPDEDGALSWMIPGLGGQVRAQIANHWAETVLEQGGGLRLNQADLIRCWKYGFFVRCCEEAVPAGADLRND